MWILYDPIVALSINIVLGIFLFFFVTNGLEIFNLLYVSDDQAISNSFGVEEKNLDTKSDLSGHSRQRGAMNLLSASVSPNAQAMYNHSVEG